MAGGCTPVLRDDFEHDSVGAQPVLPPNQPAGAQVFSLGTGARVTGSGPLVGAKSLDIQSTDARQTPTVYFNGGAVSGTRDVYFQWQQRVSGNPITRVQLYSGHFETVLALTITGTNVLVADPGLTVAGPLTPGQTSTFLVVLNPGTGRYRVTIDGAVHEGQGHAVAANPAIGMAFFQGGTRAGRRDLLTIDPVQISERNPN